MTARRFQVIQFIQASCRFWPLILYRLNAFALFKRVDHKLWRTSGLNHPANAHNWCKKSDILFTPRKIIAIAPKKRSSRKMQTSPTHSHHFGAPTWTYPQALHRLVAKTQKTKCLQAFSGRALALQIHLFHSNCTQSAQKIIFERPYFLMNRGLRPARCRY